MCQTCLQPEIPVAAEAVTGQLRLPRCVSRQVLISFHVSAANPEHHLFHVKHTPPAAIQVLTMFVSFKTFFSFSSLYLT